MSNFHIGAEREYFDKTLILVQDMLALVCCRFRCQPHNKEYSLTICQLQQSATISPDKHTYLVVKHLSFLSDFLPSNLYEF